MPTKQGTSTGPQPLPIAVVGAGFAGTMVAIYLRDGLSPEREVVLIERAPSLGRGVAYSTDNPGHLLNVRAANMSAFPHLPSHFQDWLARVGESFPLEVRETPAGVFASRGVYGHYLRSLLHDDNPPPWPRARVRHVADEVIDIEQSGERFRLSCASGRRIEAAGVVLAIGNLQGSETDDAVYFTNPWSPHTTTGLSAWDHAQRGEAPLPVLIIGTGLTAVDVALELQRRRFPGEIIMLSRRGLLPQQHAPTRAWPTPDLSDKVRSSLPLLLRRIRREIRRAATAGADWRAVLDSLRPITTGLWQGFDAAERARFLRHLRPWWDTHRHRMAPPAGEIIARMRRDGRLTVLAGRICGMEIERAQARISYRLRGAEAERSLLVRRVINATGIDSAAKTAEPLIRNLLRRNLVRLDALGLGLDVTAGLAVRAAAGREVPRLWALGPIVRGVFWECIAVPEVRAQAARVADQVRDAFGSADDTREAQHVPARQLPSRVRMSVQSLSAR
jgi:uncharacterized NAD(P)/FAD-binding protein YdhS